MRWLAWTAIVAGAFSLLQVLLFVPLLVLHIQSGGWPFRDTSSGIRFGNLLLVGAASGVLAWGGWMWRRMDRQCVGLVRWGSFGLIATGLAGWIIGILPIAMSTSAQGEFTALWMWIARLLLGVFPAYLAPAALLVIVRRDSIRRYICGEDQTAAIPEGAQISERPMKADEPLQSCARPLEYFRPIPDDFAVVAREIVRVLSWIAIAEGSIALLRFLFDRWHGNSLDLFRYLRWSDWDQVCRTLGEIGNLPAGVFLVSAGIGCLKYRRRARRALVAGAAVVALASVCTWLDERFFRVYTVQPRFPNLRSFGEFVVYNLGDLPQILAAPIMQIGIFTRRAIRDVFDTPVS